MGRRLARKWRIGIAVAAALAVAGGSEARGEPAVHTPRLEHSGRSTTIEAGSVTSAPIYSIAIGDVGRSEAEAMPWTARFGPHGLDATIWAPDRNGAGRWVVVDYRRPATPADVVRFEDVPGAFETRQLGGADLLPHPLARLTVEQWARIDYVARYRAGGTRIGLVVGTSAAEAAAMVRDLASALTDAGFGSQPSAAP